MTTLDIKKVVHDTRVSSAKPSVITGDVEVVEPAAPTEMASESEPQTIEEK